MKNKKTALHYIPWVICILLAILLAMLVFTDRKKNQKRIIQAQKELLLQNEETSKASGKDGEYIKRESSIYEELVPRLKLNSFVCWGDNGMVGNSDDSLPKEFEKIANSQLLELLSESFAEVIEQKTVPTIEISNMGISGEGMNEILVRAGVDELEIGEWALILGEKEPVKIAVRNGTTGSGLYFAQQKEADFGEAEISEVKGILVKSDEENDASPRLMFLRNRAGHSFQVGVGTDVDIESATKYLGSIPIFLFEDDSAGEADSADEFVGDLERMVQRYTVIEEENGESTEELPYVVICAVDEESELDESLKEVFGGCYIRNDTYADEMTEEAYKELAQKVYLNLDGQGCFDELKEQIAKATEELKSVE